MKSQQNGCVIVAASLMVVGVTHGGTAQAGNVYIGGGIADASQNQGISDEAVGFGPVSVPNNRPGWKLFVGTRPLSWLGAELEYLDFGSARRGAAYVVTADGAPIEPDEFYGGSVRSQAAGAAAVFYVPQPIRWVDIFGKVGPARLWTSNSASGYYPDIYTNCDPNCSPLDHVAQSQSFSDFGVLYGGGVQTHFGGLALRLEYERISAAVGQPFMVSLDASWAFGTTPYFSFERAPRAITSSAHVDTTPAVGPPLGFYVGAGFGAANQDQGYRNAPNGLPTSFPSDRFGWKVMLGARPSTWVGGELEYLDFGSTHKGPVYQSTTNGVPDEPDEFLGASGRVRAVAAVAVGYVPLPLHWLEVFGKLGAAHVMTQFNASEYDPDDSTNYDTPIGHASEAVDASDNGLLYGGGLQAHLGALGLRLEYERISSSIGEPFMVSVGANWTLGAGSHLALEGTSGEEVDTPNPYYVGLSVGQSSFQTALGGYDTGVFYRAQPLAGKAFIGVRPLSFLGAELEYVDFGETQFSPSGGVTHATGAARGGAAFVVGYLPLPSSKFDIFGKLGAARYQASWHYSGYIANPPVQDPLTGEYVNGGQAPLSGSETASGLAYGVGAQYRFGAFAVRTELEKVSTTQSFTAPSLLSLGLIYRF